MPDEKQRMKRNAEKARQPPKCASCSENYADPPSGLCPGCEAYKEHQS